MIASEITVFAKCGGPLTKRISLAADGSVKSDGSACVMACGSARRFHITGASDLSALIERLRPNEAIALGALRAGLADPVQVVTKQKLNGTPNAIARTGADIIYRKGLPALALIDFDTKGMPAMTMSEMRSRGGFWATLLSVLPALQGVGHVIRRSTSAGLYRTDTGEKLPGSGGLHVYLQVTDGADVGRFLSALHDRCWLAGFGWKLVGAGGQLLDRSIIDRVVGAPERLVFEGPPILEAPLGQERASRRPVPVDGRVLDTRAACPPLSIVEQAKLRQLQAIETQRLASESAKVRATFVAEQAKRLAERTGMSEAAAAQDIARQCAGVLRPGIVLPFDDTELAGTTVGDVLADPARFEGATLADPLEGVDYGVGKAKVMRRADGTPWIHSFAHGRTVYALAHNADSVRAAMAAASDSDVVKIFLQLAIAGDLGLDEIEPLRGEAAKRSGMGKRAIGQMLRQAKQEQAAKSRQQERERHQAQRDDPRPAIKLPIDDAPWLPQMTVLNDVISVSRATHPSLRDIDGTTAYTSQIAIPAMHAFTPFSANTGKKT